MKRSEIKRFTPIRRANPERRARKYARNFSGDGEGGGIEHDTWIRARYCCLCVAARVPQVGPTQAAHVIARGMGAAKGRWTDLVPLCPQHHELQGRIGNGGIAKTFDVDLGYVAKRLVREHLEEIGAI